MFNNAPSECREIRFAEITVTCSKPHILGVTIDRLLTFDNHITNIVQSRKYHIRWLIVKDTATTLAWSIVLSRLDCCNAVLFGTTSKNSDRLQRAQNRITCNTPYCSPSSQLRKRCIGCLLNNECAVMTCKLQTHQRPLYLDEDINDYIPVWTLRSLDRALLRLPSTKTVTAARAFLVATQALWNNLPTAVAVHHRNSPRHLYLFTIDIKHKVQKLINRNIKQTCNDN